VGGRGWIQDASTVIGEIDEGWEYYVRIGAAQIRVVVVSENGHRYLSTDSAEVERNALLALPSCAGDDGPGAG
jgi:hypothetical protein